MSEIHESHLNALPVGKTVNRTNIMKALKSRIRDGLRWCGSRIWVTPFAPYILSTHFLSDEIEVHHLRYLNPKSKDLRYVEVISTRAVVYVQEDLLEEFCANHLNKFEQKIIVIVGQWKKSKPASRDSMARMIASSQVEQVFLQNLSQSDVKVQAFPYGADFFTIPVLLATRLSTFSLKTIKVLTPFARAHSHLDSSDYGVRRALTPMMESPLPLRLYLKRLAKSKFVIAPPGDRPDTYRHWESLIMGATPVSTHPREFDAMYGNRALRVKDLVRAAGGEGLQVLGGKVDRTEFLRFWRKRTLQSLQRLH